MRTVTSVEAQNHFGELLDNAQREPITITRRGRPVAFVVSQHDMAELTDARNKRSQAVADFEAYFAGVDARLGEEAKLLTEVEVGRMVKEGGAGEPDRQGCARHQHAGRCNPVAAVAAAAGVHEGAGERHF